MRLTGAECLPRSITMGRLSLSHCAVLRRTDLPPLAIVPTEPRIIRLPPATNARHAIRVARKGRVTRQEVL